MFVSCDNCLDGLEELLLPKLLAGLVGFQHMAWNGKKKKTVFVRSFLSTLYVAVLC